MPVAPHKNRGTTGTAINHRLLAMVAAKEISVDAAIVAVLSQSLITVTLFIYFVLAY